MNWEEGGEAGGGGRGAGEMGVNGYYFLVFSFPRPGQLAVCAINARPHQSGAAFWLGFHVHECSGCVYLCCICLQCGL